jgi:hypothetical protein
MPHAVFFKRNNMRVRKPAQQQTKSFIFRPRRELNGLYSIGFSIETSGTGAVVTFNWCGSRQQIHLLPQLSSYMTNLRLPVSLSGNDVFVLSVTSPAPLILSIDMWSGGEPTEDITLETIDGETSVETVCANPATDGDRKFEDILILGQAPVPAKREKPVGRIASLRALPEGALLYLFFHRPADTPPEDLLITAAVGPMRRLCVIAANKETNGVTFWLQPEAAEESWPLILYCNRAFAWAGTAQRGYDAVFLPAFSLVDSPEGGEATQ